jgi:hypothetical protein
VESDGGRVNRNECRKDAVLLKPIKVMLVHNQYKVHLDFCLTVTAVLSLVVYLTIHMIFLSHSCALGRS